MNIEEAIEILKMWNKAEELVINESTDYDKTVYIQRKEAIETLLTAYEKEKEKNKNLNWYFENQKDNFVHKDKIKTKIEEIEKLKTDDENSIINKIVNWFINQMQSLLEKE